MSIDEDTDRLDVNECYTSHFRLVQHAEQQRIYSGLGESTETPDSKEADRPMIGLAFSGGGIRSASFGMGVMQSLVAADKMKLMDYLSTVSGGGYLGSSLTWFLSQKMSPAERGYYGTEPDNFPFGRKNIGEKTDQERKDNAILNYIRQHGNYLVPGQGLSSLSFVGSVLRVMLGSFLVYFSLLTTVMFSLVAVAGLFAQDVPTIGSLFSFSFSLIIVVLITYFVMDTLWYSWQSYAKGVSKYPLDVAVQRLMGKYLSLILVATIFAALPVVQNNLHLITSLFGSEDKPDFVISSSVSISSSFIGGVLSFLLHSKQFKGVEENSPMQELLASLQLIAASFLMLFGFLFGSYLAAYYLFLWLFPFGIGKWLAISGVFIFLLITGSRCNLNIYGLNRMYRNRLMETFMPDRKSIESGRWHQANAVNSARVADMCAQDINPRPYHLINCNIVLVDSNNAKYRGRKGDSFLVSPLYCGADATGWIETANYLQNPWRQGLTLPTAMAISGAAANPNSGVAGRGPTTNKFLSLLMSLFNLRLGFWADNPNCKNAQNLKPPNYIRPGLKSAAFFFKGLSEDEETIELTDGGHFENLAIYELFRRRLDVIVVSDAGCDSNYEFADMANATEKARVDFGIDIKFDAQYSLEALMPSSMIGQLETNRDHSFLAENGFALARINYPSVADKPEKAGYLVYLKPTLVEHLSTDIMSYKRLNGSFPHQKTADQFFDEVQFEAYRELGYSLGKKFTNKISSDSMSDKNCKSCANDNEEGTCVLHRIVKIFNEEHWKVESNSI